MTIINDADIERVARAICRAGICGPRDHLDEQENLYWRRFTLESKAAIDAILQKPEADVAKENLHAANVSQNELRELGIGDRRGTVRKSPESNACGHDHT